MFKNVLICCIQYMFIIYWVGYHKVSKVGWPYTCQNFIYADLLYDLWCGLKPAESAHCITKGTGEDTLSECSTQDWFTRFSFGYHDVEDWFRSGRSSGLDGKRLLQLVKDVSKHTKSHLAEAFGGTTIKCSWAPSSTLLRFQAFEVGTQLLTETKRQCHDEGAVSLLWFRRTRTWLNTIVIGEEKWVLAANIQHQ